MIPIPIIYWKKLFKGSDKEEQEEEGQEEEGQEEEGQEEGMFIGESQSTFEGRAFRAPTKEMLKKCHRQLNIKKVKWASIPNRRAKVLAKPSKFVRAAPDGNCAFNCISISVRGFDDKDLLIRNVIHKMVGHMQANHLYPDRVPLLKRGAWGGVEEFVRDE